MIETDKYVVLTNDQYHEACKRALLDDTYLGWGHCGFLLYGGRIMIRVETLGM